MRMHELEQSRNAVWQKEKSRLAIGFILAVLSSSLCGFILGWFSHLEWVK